MVQCLDHDSYLVTKRNFLNQKVLGCGKNKILNRNGFLKNFLVGSKLSPVFFYGRGSYYKRRWEHYLISGRLRFFPKRDLGWVWRRSLSQSRKRLSLISKKFRAKRPYKNVRHLTLIKGQKLKKKPIVLRMRKGSLFFFSYKKSRAFPGASRSFYLRKRRGRRRIYFVKRALFKNFYSGLFFNYRFLSLQGGSRKNIMAPRHICVLTFRFTRKNLFFILSDKISGRILMAKQMVAFPHLYETKRHKFYRENILHILEGGFFPFLFKYIKGTRYGYKYIAYSFKGYHPFLRRRGRARHLSFFVKKLTKRLIKHRHRVRLRARRRLKSRNKGYSKNLVLPPTFYSFALNFARAFNGCKLRPYKTTSKALRWRFKKKRRNIFWRIKKRTKNSRYRVCLDLKKLYFYRAP